MKRHILLKPYNHPVFYKDKIFSLHNGHNAFYKFDSFLNTKNISIHTVDVRKTIANMYMYADMPYPWNIPQWLEIIFNRNAKRMLIVLESPLVNPFNQFRFLWKFFDSVLTWNTDIEEVYSAIKIPQLESKPFKMQTKDKLLVLVNANKKIPLPLRLFSLKYSNLYKKRLEAINTLTRIVPEDFDLFGDGWHGYLCNKGEIPENKKLEVLSKYRFSICFENTSAPGYITEKIFDCFKSNVIPVYLGAPDVSNYIPQNCFIDFRRFSSYTELVEHLQTMSENEYRHILDNIHKFLNGKQYIKWSQHVFFNTILEKMNYV